jgi:hypothetical protein
VPTRSCVHVRLYQSLVAGHRDGGNGTATAVPLRCVSGATAVPLRCLSGRSRSRATAPNEVPTCRLTEPWRRAVTSCTWCRAVSVHGTELYRAVHGAELYKYFSPSCMRTWPELYKDMAPSSTECRVARCPSHSAVPTRTCFGPLAPYKAMAAAHCQQDMAPCLFQIAYSVIHVYGAVPLRRHVAQLWRHRT